MHLREYISNLERGGASELAKRLGVSVSYLSQLASGASAISPIRCVEIERETEGEVTRKDLRPEDWMAIWPELAHSVEKTVGTPKRRATDPKPPP